MTRRASRKQSRFVVAPPAPPAEARAWIESDSYDRAVYAGLRRDSPALRELEQRGSALVPHFDCLLQDIFCSLFKYNVVFVAAGSVVPSAALNRQLLSALHDGELLSILRAVTILDEGKAGLAALLLGEGALRLLKSERPLSRRDLLDLWDVHAQEEALRERVQTTHAARGLAGDAELSDDARQRLEREAVALASRARAEAARLRQRAGQLEADLARGRDEMRARFRKEAIRVAQQLDDTVQQAESWSMSLGGGYRSSPGAQIELGKRLAGNEKLKKLARLVGRMKTHALALRRSLGDRASEEVYEVGMGDDLSRLLPPELLSFCHPVLRKDFSRRLLDRELLLYALRGAEKKGKGPLVVCLDGSSSMMGDKEVWAKALTLTLLELARRQRRLCRVICFSSAETPLLVIDLNPRIPYEVKTERVLELAEYFPGGGTDFQKPLDAARRSVRESAYKRGDIVLVTDGECNVDPAWAAQFKTDKAVFGFSLFSILIDVGASSHRSLAELSDRVTTVTQLTSEGVKDLFVRV